MGAYLGRLDPASSREWVTLLRDTLRIDWFSCQMELLVAYRGRDRVPVTAAGLDVHLGLSRPSGDIARVLGPGVTSLACKAKGPTSQRGEGLVPATPGQHSMSRERCEGGG